MYASERHNHDQTTVSLGSISASHGEKLKPQTVEKLIKQFKAALKSERPLDVALQVLDHVKAQLGCTKLTLFPVDYFTTTLLTANLPKEKQSHVHSISYQDEQGDNVPQQLQAICRRPSELCQKIIFKSLRSLHSDVVISN